MKILISEVLYDTPGVSMNASSDASTELGTTLEIAISISSGEPTHSVLVNAFGDSILFTNVATTDTLSVAVPSTLTTLGSWDISIMVQDWGCARAFDTLTVQVDGTLTGSLDISTPVV